MRKVFNAFHVYGPICRRVENIGNNVTQRGASMRRWCDFEPETLQRFFLFTTHTESRSVYPCDNAHSARWARVRESRSRRMNSIFIARQLPMFSQRGSEGEEMPSISKILICYTVNIFPLLIYNKSILAIANSLR